jgi:hypothetical protein
MREFMNRRSGGYRLPIPTNELIRLLEEHAEKVDTYADLPEGIHGQTSLYYDRRPIVKIAESPVCNCHRENIIDAPKNDWTEWQAGWVSGAIVMPASALRTWAAECVEKFGANLLFRVSRRAGTELIKLAVERCDVSVLGGR